MASLEGPDHERYDLTGDLVTIGRDSTNDIVLGQDAKVSRLHAELRLSEGRWLLIDLNSQNGTVVNGRRSFQHPLRDGDRVGVGSSTFIYAAGVDPNATEIETIPAGVPDPDLSDREREILKYVASGLTDRDTAEQMHISVSTVRSHLDRIRDKTGLRRRSELTRLAIGLGIDRR